jgi:hypothetical protein
MLIGALPAAGQSLPATGSAAPAHSVAGAGPTTDRDTYTQKARDDMQQWQQKLHDFSENAKAKGQQAGDAAGNELNAAWTKTLAEAQKLQTTGADGWESAKASYEKASHELADAWDKVRR